MWIWIERRLEDIVRGALARGVWPQFALGVIGPVAIICLSLLYTRSTEVMYLTAVNASVYAILLGFTFIGNIRRVRRLAATQAWMRQYDGPFALLLRSFGKTELYHGFGTFQGPDPYAAPPHQVSVVATLERALRAQGIPLVSLGGFNLALDSDHELFWLTCDDRDWTDNIEVLMANAGLILVCPDNSPGISTELAMLHDAGHLEKAVFVMAPAIRSGGYISGDDDRSRKADAWDRMTEDAQALGFRFPPYDPDGAVLRFRNDLRIAEQPDEKMLNEIRSLLAAYRPKEATALGYALLSLVSLPPADWPRYALAREELSQADSMGDPPNYLHPPGEGELSPFTFAMAYAMALVHHVIVLVLLVFFNLRNYF